MIDHKRMNRILALFVFVLSFITYYRTIAPTVSFWDCGEFIACSYTLGIPHPPGAPLYLLIGRIFTLIPWTGDIALRVNIISALTSALTVLLTYLIIVQLLEIWRGAPKKAEDKLILYASGIVGALAFAFSDTFWFNAVEAEVYAISMFFTAIVIWLALVWYHRADERGSERYLLLALYCVGLSQGIHLLNILTLPAVLLIVFFRKRETTFGRFVGSSLLAGLSYGVSLLVVYGLLKVLHPLYSPIVTPLVHVMFPAIGKLAKPELGVAAIVVFPLYIGFHAWLGRKKPEFKTYTSCALLISLGALLMVSIYPGVIKGVPWLVDKGEFGVIFPLLVLVVVSAMLFKIYPNFAKKGGRRPTIAGAIWSVIGLVSVYYFFYSGHQVWDAGVFWALIVLLVFVWLGFGFSRWIRHKSVQMALMGLVLILVGYSSYLVIFLRSNLDPVIDENDPETTQAMVSYLNRDQYGQWSITDRQRWKSNSPYKAEYEAKGQGYYLWKYQIKRMYLRYFAWQYMGKGVTLDKDNFIKDTFSGRGLYWIPFLVGMLGLVWHFRKDWRQALSMLVLFVMTGVAIVIYLNQEDPQPRERDYVYVASYFAFALWIGIGVSAILEQLGHWLRHDEQQRFWAQGVAVLLLAVLIPINMYGFNYASHDRTGNYVAYDYSYNILQSCAPNGILFTNGDNDTFPLWYLQTCVKDTATGEMGIRKDIRIVNLSLLNTPWYIKQLKSAAPKVPISLTDTEIDDLAPVAWKPVVVALAVPPAAYLRDLPDMAVRRRLRDTSAAEGSEIAFEVAPTIGSRDRGGIRVQDRMILDILFANKWQKPIYFAVTVSRQNQLISKVRPEYNIERYFRMDGLAFRLVSYPDSLLSDVIMSDLLLNKFQYRGLDDPSVYYNDNVLGLLTNYRAGFMRLALNYRDKKQYEPMVAVMDTMMTRIPPEVVPFYQFGMMLNIGQLYNEAGRPDRYRNVLDRAKDMATTPEAQVQLGFELARINEVAAAAELIEKAKTGKIDEKLRQQADMLLKYIDQMKIPVPADSEKNVQ